MKSLPKGPLCSSGTKAWCIIFIGSFCLGLIAHHLVLGTPICVKGRSMAPTLSQDSVVIAYPATFLSKIQRGDIVIIDDGCEDSAIKRIIGKPNEIVSFSNGKIFVNGRELQEDYLEPGTKTYPQAQQHYPLGIDEYFVLGDNRNTSMDSRVYGPIRRSQIKAHAIIAVNRPKILIPKSKCLAHTSS